MCARFNLTYPTALVLRALAEGCRYGFDVMDATGLASGTVYPLLRRLEALGFVTADWEGEEAARRDGRPARRYYQLTAEGAAVLGEARRKFAGLEHGLRAPSAPRPAEG
ncbi:MAG TPA: PadR family transcriptional regulator [Longimicrobium sp.]|jgi:DNA-binding PadR family transcriptional regulator